MPLADPTTLGTSRRWNWGSTGHRDRIPHDVVLRVVDVVDAHEVTDVVTACQPNVIYHLAAQISVRCSVRRR